MNTDTGEMGRYEDVLRNAKPGERVIPATIIPDPRTQPKRAPQFYGPRKPLREVRREIREARKE
jgi:hypothetical protein